MYVYLYMYTFLRVFLRLNVYSGTCIVLSNNKKGYLSI